jgi:GNAT superfamily N-acetyltransferase
MPDATVNVTQARTEEELDAVRDLFTEYACSLGWDLSSGWIAKELAELPGPYAPPAGSLLLARVDGRPAGALGLQLVPEAVRVEGADLSHAGELKRLFVRPEYRRHGVGRALMERAEAEARARGYEALLLTTNAEVMPLAQGLYGALGYAETAPYRDDMPWPAIRWMRKALTATP